MPGSSIFDFDSSFGALEIGTFVSMFLLGVATLQAWNYFRDFPNDPLYIRVMSYFGMRVFRVTQSMVLAAGIWILAVVRMAFTISITVLAVNNGTLAVADTEAFKWQAVLELSIAAFTDVCTALALCIGLLLRRTGSGLLTSLISIAQLVSYLTMSGNFIWIAFFSISSKMFSNSLFASLNQRPSNRRILLERSLPSGSTRFTFHRPEPRNESQDMELISPSAGTDKAVLVIGHSTPGSPFEVN
ncbi:hypothetical protein AURDEDRAFT_130010 [Auricularia subglabra TFB-10046 SS5]|uniref:DUF6534 domain-containing protein n=1 Tax=Auricularia subglabra (strain TFB-10046 / SS5) TaxID=717982 RepID=J0WUT7_AURST|nr:hypothetical protein AURDEDRAFT_130010 [Auricularia subglabra TFB-10046 SS5]